MLFQLFESSCAYFYSRIYLSNSFSYFNESTRLKEVTYVVRFRCLLQQNCVSFELISYLMNVVVNIYYLVCIQVFLLFLELSRTSSRQKKKIQMNINIYLAIPMFANRVIEKSLYTRDPRSLKR